MVVTPLSLCAVNECVHPCSVNIFTWKFSFESSLSILAMLCSPSLLVHLSTSNIGQAKCFSLHNYTSLGALVVVFQKGLPLLPMHVGMGGESNGRRDMVGVYTEGDSVSLNINCYWGES